MAQAKAKGVASASGRKKRLETSNVVSPEELKVLSELRQKVLWLSSWMIHNANHVRPNRDGLKVGGHQASSSSMVSLMTALYFNVLTPRDRVAVKPHASPNYHAIQYLLGRQTRDKLEAFRALGGAQSYPSRTKDADDVDFSTGSVGMGVGITTFASITQDYLRFKSLIPDDEAPGRMVALMGDAELDEGNVFEALLEGWKHDVRNLWWVIDYNRQSLDSVITDNLFSRVDDIFRTTGWEVITLKYGKQLQRAFNASGGDALRQWIDDCPNSLYSALVYKGGAGWREHLTRDLGDTAGIKALLDEYDDSALHALMTNLAGHDLESILEAFHSVESDLPYCFIAYTIKGWGLPFAGHKDNHAGLMNLEQMEAFKTAQGIKDGEEWEPFSGLNLPNDELLAFLEGVPFTQDGTRGYEAAKIEVPVALPFTYAAHASTQEAFGRILSDIGRDDSELAERIVTTSPDVTVSTNLGAWVNRRGIFDRRDREDVFREEKVVSAQRWNMSRAGQHIELGIAENNLFLALGALGLAGPVFGARLLPVGTLYDPFIMRGLDALNYATYQDARFMLVATPSGISLAPEGGAHQSISTTLIGLGQDKLVSFDPGYTDELAVIMRWGFDYMQQDDGGSVYLRLSTRSIDQPEREMTPQLARDILAGGYWQVAPQSGAELAIAYSGVVASEAVEAHGYLLQDVPGSGLLALPSPDQLHKNWLDTCQARTRGENPPLAHVEKLLAGLSPEAAIVTVVDAHPATLSWIGSVAGHRVYPLGVDHFGQSGDVVDLYHTYGIDADAILDACASACLGK